MWRKLLGLGPRTIEAAEHLHFADFLVSQIVDWRLYFLASVAWLATFLGIPAVRDWSPLIVWLVSVAVGAGVAIIYLALNLFLESRRNTKAAVEGPPGVISVLPSDIAESIPNLRVADEPAVLGLFEGKERDRLLPLLEGGALTAWGRRGAGEPAPTKIPATIWSNHNICFLPNRGPGTIDQTFVRPKGRLETAYWDVFLNASQIGRVWPHIDNEAHIPLHDAAQIAYEAAEDADVLDVLVPSTGSPETKLTHFKYLFMVDSEAELFGVKPPSTKSRPIPKIDLINGLHPADGDVSELIGVGMLDSATYVNVTVRRKDLRRVINNHIAEAKGHIGR